MCPTTMRRGTLPTHSHAYVDAVVSQGLVKDRLLVRLSVSGSVTRFRLASGFECTQRCPGHRTQGHCGPLGGDISDCRQNASVDLLSSAPDQTPWRADSLIERPTCQPHIRPWQALVEPRRTLTLRVHHDQMSYLTQRRPRRTKRSTHLRMKTAMHHGANIYRNNCVSLNVELPPKTLRRQQRQYSWCDAPSQFVHSKLPNWCEIQIVTEI